MQIEIYSQIHEIERSHWWYVARRKIIFDWTLRTLADYSSPKILDIGCGTGFNIELLKTDSCQHVVGLDFSVDALGFCQSRHLTRLICSDGARPPFGPESFDIIMALDLIEHLADDVLAIHELARILKPGGSLIIFTPAFNFLWSLQDEVGHHYRRYTGGELRQKLEKAGLSIHKLTYANTFLFPLIWVGRVALRLSGNNIQVTSENDLHPGWSNTMLQTIFAAERPLLRYANLPFGVSLLCVAKKLTSTPSQITTTISAK
ncbi:MAG: class I SAM-dependent methyltransferase [Chloroflexi bacterium]|nr:class I SAM-dependent methyltransferase [Chloroflexota bacterium]